MAEGHWNLKTLRNIGIMLSKRYTQEELKNLASDLGIDYGDLEGTIQDSKARSLVRHMHNRRKLGELLEVGEMTREDIDWKALIEPDEPVEEISIPQTELLVEGDVGEVKIEAERSDVQKNSSEAENVYGIEWIEIPAGAFIMGKGDEAHELNLPNFYISKTEITNEQYAHFVKDTNYAPPNYWEEGIVVPADRQNHPVVEVSWLDATAYCKWLSERSGLNIQLPSEAEWEKAAGWDPIERKKRLFPWGDQFDKHKCNSSHGRRFIYGMFTYKGAPVDNFPGGASAYGVLDMSGNVAEWTRSIHQPYPYDASDGRENHGFPQEGRTIRGGSYLNYDVSLSVADRTYQSITSSLETVGFRIVKLLSNK